MITTALRSAACFRDVGEQELAGIARHAGERCLSPGEALFEQGESAHRFFLVAVGRTKVTMLTAEGKQVLIGLAGPGEFCGLAVALARSEYPSSARAIVATRAVAWPTTYWPTLIEEHPRLAVALTRALGRHVDEVNNRMAELATVEVERRVALAVLRLADRAGCPVEGGVRIDFPLTRQDIAEMTGTTLHSVSRIVSAWANHGLVRRGRARLVVSDLAGLKRIARGQPG